MITNNLRIHAQRRSFVNWLLEQNFLHKIVCRDKAHFTLDEFRNKYILIHRNSIIKVHQN